MKYRSSTYRFDRVSNKLYTIIWAIAFKDKCLCENYIKKKLHFSRYFGIMIQIWIKGNIMWLYLIISGNYNKGGKNIHGKRNLS